MQTRDTILSVLRALHIENRVKALIRKLRHNTKRPSNIDRKLIASYLGDNHKRKLHIGCGQNIIDSWLNSDYFVKSDKILGLDATQPFPFEDNSFAYIFSEHMIEHISYQQGIYMLVECNRILMPGGRIRIATPDIAFLIDLYKKDKTELQKNYLQRATAPFITYSPYVDETFVINNFFRSWGHQFIYSEKVLRHSLEQTGFSEVTRYDLNDSQDEELRNLENESRMPPGFLRLETMILEGNKPKQIKSL